MNKLVAAYLNSVKNCTEKSSSLEAEKLIEKYLQDGWTDKQIERAIDTRHPKATKLGNILSPTENLIESEKIYFHSELRIFPPVPKSRIDDEGNIIYVNLSEDFELQMVKTYSMYQLLKYYYSKFNIIPSQNEVKRDIGGIKYLMKFIDLDRLLFLIDVAHSIITENDYQKPLSPLELQNFTREALSIYEQKVAFDNVTGVIKRNDRM
jgi:hypothetical protein